MFSAFASGFVSLRVVVWLPCPYGVIQLRHIYDTSHRTAILHHIVNRIRDNADHLTFSKSLYLVV